MLDEMKSMEVLALVMFFVLIIWVQMTSLRAKIPSITCEIVSHPA